MRAPSSAYRIEALGKKHGRDKFSCGAEPLDRYLQQQARQDADKRVAASFVLVEPPSVEVLGYYTLSASSIVADELPAQLARKLPRYPAAQTYWVRSASVREAPRIVYPAPSSSR